MTDLLTLQVLLAVACGSLVGFSLALIGVGGLDPRGAAAALRGRRG